MRVSIKSFDVNMEVKNNGIEFEVADNDGNHKGDVILTKTGIAWCKGRTQRKNAIKVSWADFMKWIETQ